MLRWAVDIDKLAGYLQSLLCADIVGQDGVGRKERDYQERKQFLHDLRNLKVKCLVRIM